MPFWCPGRCMAGLYQDNCTLPPYNFEKEKKRGVFYCTLQLSISILIYCSSCDSFSLGDEYISEQKTKTYAHFLICLQGRRIPILCAFKPKFVHFLKRALFWATLTLMWMMSSITLYCQFTRIVRTQSSQEFTSHFHCNCL